MTWQSPPQHGVSGEEPQGLKDYEDMLFLQGASHDHLKELLLWEEQVRGRGPEADVLGGQREQVLHGMMNLAVRSQMNHDDWSCAVSLLDSYLASLGAEDVTKGTQMLPLTCVAVLRLVKKFHGNVAEPKGSFNMWLSMAKQVLPIQGKWMEFSETMLRQHEVDILQSVQWQVQEPLQQQFLNIYCTRLGALTSQQYEPQIAWVKQKSMFFARLLLFVESASAQNSPQEFALGMFCLHLARGQLLSLHSLRPDEVPVAYWTSALQQLGLPCHVEASSFQALPLVEAATAASRRELKEATRRGVERLLELRVTHPAMRAAWNS